MDTVHGELTLWGERASRVYDPLSAERYRRHDEVEVGHIMTPWERVSTLDWQALGGAQVADLAAFFQTTAATHVVVSEQLEKGGTAVRGIISRTRLERQLGHAI